jgi:hypothetical protein
MEKIKVYLGCALTHSPVRYKKKIKAFKLELQKIPYIEVLEFINSLDGVPDPAKNPLHIYTNDIHDCVGCAKVIIGELSFPSTGLGYELSTAIEKHGIRTMMCAQKNAEVSYLLKGVVMHQNNECATFHQYEKSIIELLPYFLKEITLLYAMQN